MQADDRVGRRVDDRRQTQARILGPRARRQLQTPHRLLDDLSRHEETDPRRQERVHDPRDHVGEVPHQLPSRGEQPHVARSEQSGGQDRVAGAVAESGPDRQQVEEQVERGVHASGRVDPQHAGDRIGHRDEVARHQHRVAAIGLGDEDVDSVREAEDDYRVCQERGRLGTPGDEGIVQNHVAADDREAKTGQPPLGGERLVGERRRQPFAAYVQMTTRRCRASVSLVRWHPRLSHAASMPRKPRLDIAPRSH